MPRYTVILEPEDDEIGGFAASVPALPGCYSQGATRDEAIENIREAIGLRLGVMRRDGEQYPVDVSPIVTAIDTDPISPSRASVNLDALLDGDGTPVSRRRVG